MISLNELTPSQTLLRLLTTNKGLNDMTEETDYLTPDEKLENLITDFKENAKKFVKAKNLQDNSNAK